jgi:lycopene beta-cyclase
MFDVLVIGAGPAGLAISAALCGSGLRVVGLSAGDPATLWPNTYGIWRDELEPLGLSHLLGPHWNDCVSYAAGRELVHTREYALIDNAALQQHLLAQCQAGGMEWRRGSAAAVTHHAGRSVVTARDGAEHTARLVIDASGHFPVLVKRPATMQVAYQAAYGIVGAFASAPVKPRQLVLMDYRADHLSTDERRLPPTFLYAMDLGGGRFFVEETSLAASPAVPFDLLEQRLYRRLAYMGAQIEEIQHVERCLFPMNMPLPDLGQPVLGYGGAASMVHPISGYQVGAALRRAQPLASAIAQALGASERGAAPVAYIAWRALWPNERVRRRNLYLFGLENLMRFDERQLNGFFSAFFQLPFPQWSGYLSDTLNTSEILHTMWTLFAHAPAHVRFALMGSMGSQGALLLRAVTG